MSTVVLRPAALPDLDALETLENSVFAGDRLSRRSLRYYIDAPTAVFLVLDHRGRIAGDALVAFRRGSPVARLYSIAVEAEAAGHGHGKRLLDACEQAVRERGRKALRLEVRDDNAAAIRLYERTGYQRFGRTPDYYEDGAAAIRFQKTLAPDDAIGPPSLP